MKINSHQDIMRLARKSALTPHTQKLLDLPETAQDHYDLSSMINFAPLYSGLIRAIGPHRIVEIGSEDDANSACVAALAHELAAQHLIVSTHTSMDAQLAERPNTQCIDSTSSEFLDTFEGAEIYFTDGGHAYATLVDQLELVSKIDAEGPLVLFVHGTGWPLGHRDAYDDPDVVDAVPDPSHGTGGPVPWHEELQVDGCFANRPGRSHARSEGGVQNGLMAAVLDFLERESQFDCFHVPAFYGLSVLWRKDRLNERQLEAFKHIGQVCAQVRPLLATLEWNRLLHVILHESCFALTRENDEKLEALQDQNQRLIQHFAKEKHELTRAFAKEKRELQRQHAAQRQAFDAEGQQPDESRMAQLEAQSSEAARLYTQETQTLNTKIRALKKVVFSETCRADDINGRLSRALHRAKEAEAKTRQQESKVNEQGKKIEQQHKKIEDQCKRLDIIRNSHSWTMTKPLRRLGAIPRRILGR